ncbi:MAG TPA: GFA family protein [Kofleriaceae bacterium]|jgi:hypothetical protein|nr:GFA family protein [Kofleriaceae bacterium]
MTSELSGGCGCGAVRYHLATPPMFVNCCHCLDCQRQTGSAFVINAIIETDRLEVTGTPAVPIEMKTESGRPHLIYRCPTCQVAVWSVYGGRDQFRFVRVGTLDDPRALAPDAHIFVRSKQPWIDLGSAPQFDVYYDSATQWSAESLARRERALTKG